MEYNKRSQEQLPVPKELEVLRSLTPEELLDYKRFLLDKYSEIETQVHLVNDVLAENGIELEEG